MSAWKLTVKTAAGTTIELEGKPTETIAQTRARLQDKEGIAPDQQRLFYDGVQLEDHLTIEHYMKTAPPPMAAPPMSAEIQFFVKGLKGETIKLKAKTTDTVAQVKAQLHASQGIKPEDQVLTYGGKSMEMGLTLADYDIGEGSTVDFRDKVKGGNI
jgi:ubiquitin C